MAEDKSEQDQDEVQWQLGEEVIEPFADPEETAEMAGLRYVNDGEPGYRRQRWGRGFTYLSPDGERVADPELRARFDALVIPPAWMDVWICATPDGHIQVTGRDEKGRKQYIYHPRWDEVRDQKKYNRMVSFGECLPTIRARVEQDLRLRKFSQDKVLAIVVRLLEETLIRIGNLEYARENASFGLTTLQGEHLEINGSQLVFEFNGKRGKQQEVSIRNPRLARQLIRLQDLPGQLIFQYLGEDGECCQAVTSTDVNLYLRRVSGQNFTAKDFRTWGGTINAAIELYQLGPGESEKERKQSQVKAVREVARSLGNTPAICREYYIHPRIFQAYEDETLFSVMQRSIQQADRVEDGLIPAERAVIELLRKDRDG